MIGKKVWVRIDMWRAMSAVAGILALLGMFVSLFAIQEAAAAANPATEIAYPVKDFRNGDARFYKYPAGDGVTIKYFVLKSSDGVIRAAFDACDVCWREGKGYTQKGDFMVCNNCGRRFASVRVNEVTGGCNPSPLTREIRGDKVVLQAKDILTGKPYFTFGKGSGK
ncbi:MAG: Fe-S-containing protein [Syntrophales bacterium]